MDASLPSVYDVTICMQGNSGYWIQPPPNLPRRGGTDTLGCLISNGLPISEGNLHLPFGGEREGADVSG